ncbi:MAG TPA: hypothetical protein ENI51_05045 [Candidatus Atribacteria bacterium]|nr:hypothetical protein [Candidatus Atribacteria bacterium]
MNEWKKLPPKFVKKEKKLPKPVLFYLLFTIFEIIILASTGLGCRFFQLDPILAIIVFLVVFVFSIIVGIVIWIIFIVRVVEEIKKI